MITFDESNIPPPFIIHLNGREIRASRTDTLADLARVLLGDIPGDSTVTLAIDTISYGDADHRPPVTDVHRFGLRIDVTVVHAGVDYVCSLRPDDHVTVSCAGERIAVAEWNPETGKHSGATFVDRDCGLDDSELETILDHASEAWRKHRR